MLTGTYFQQTGLALSMWVRGSSLENICYDVITIILDKSAYKFWK